MHRLPIALLLAALLAAAGCGRSAAPPRTVPDGASLDEGLQRRYLRALAAASAGDVPGAEKALAPLLQARPIHVPSHLLHQDLVRRAGGAEGLAREYATLAEERPGTAEADLLLVRAKGGTLEERIPGYQAAAVKDPAAPWPRVALATARTELARALLGRAASREREGFAEEGIKLRAQARASAEGAITEGERAVALAPGLAAAHAALGHALGTAVDLVAVQDHDRRAMRGRSLDSYGKALALDPGDPNLLFGRAMVRRDGGDREGAAEDLAAAAEAAPRDVGILAARADTLGDAGLGREAAEAWRATALADPGNPDVRVALGTALGGLGQWKGALEEYRKADALYAAGGGERWKARRGLVTALAQIGLDEQDPRRLSEALDQLRAYRKEGGPDAAWAAKLAELLGEETPEEKR